MPNLVTGDVHVDVALTNISVAFAQEANQFIYNRVFPFVPVSRETGKYFTYDREDWRRIEAEVRAPGTMAAQSTFGLSTSTYDVERFSLAMPIPEEIKVNADAPIDMLRDAAAYITYNMMLKADKKFADDFFAGSVFTGSSTGSDITPGTKWDASGGDPVSDIMIQSDSVFAKTGRRPNKIVMGDLAWQAFINQATVLDRIKYTQTGLVTEQLAASLLSLDEVIVARTQHNSAAEGDTEVVAKMFDEDGALLLFVPSGPSLMTPAAGYTFVWDSIAGVNQGMRMRRYRDELRDSDIVEGDLFCDQKLVAADAGAMFVAVDT